MLADTLGTNTNTTTTATTGGVNAGRGPRGALKVSSLLRSDVVVVVVVINCTLAAT